DIHWSFSMSDAASFQPPEDRGAGLIERVDPGLDTLIAFSSGVETICEGFTWSEGPVWKDSALFFSDVPANILYRWTPAPGRAEVFLEPSGGIPSNPDFVEPGSNGLALDSEGRLLLCQHGARRVVRLEDDGRTQTVLADRFEGRRLNNPNDLVVHSSGAVYFTDPSYGFKGRDASPLKEIPWNGVFRIAPDRTVDLLTKDLPFPNGLAFSPDEKTLYVAVSDASFPRIVAFDVLGDGLLGASRLFFDAVPLLRRSQSGTCDGLKVDVRGNIFTSAPGGVAVLSPEGQHLGTIRVGLASNCCWGDDGTVLYITADDHVCRIRTTTQGTPFRR
ncbi:MAG TPA: SMP-30/gluconolactonase/LRE family protein, partial [Terrimicrobiaceae bacterium]